MRRQHKQQLERVLTDAVRVTTIKNTTTALGPLSSTKWCDDFVYRSLPKPLSLTLLQSYRGLCHIHFAQGKEFRVAWG